MEISNETVIPVDTPTETAPQAAPETLIPDTLPVTGADAPVVPEAAIDAYKPDFTYKVVNEVKEFDPRLRGIIKTKEDEAYIRDIITKAEGLEVNKKNLTTSEQRYKDIESKYVPLQKDVDQVLQMAEKKDISSICAVFKISEKELMEHAYQLATLNDLPEHQRKAYNERNELSRSQYSLKQEAEEMRKELDSIRLTQRQTELQNVIYSPEYGSIAKDFDSRNGQDAFWNEVVTRGASYAQLHGVVKTPNEVISEIITKYGLKREVPKVNAPSSGPASLPVIPNTGSGGAAPVMKKPKTLSELKAYAKTLED